MAGIYFHIPFCKSRCIYCDFYSTTWFKYKDILLESMLEELAMRHTYLKGEKIKTIYFGGGTPSLLDVDHIKRLIGKINYLFSINEEVVEITLEANPDDLEPVYLKKLKDIPVNRLSIGIQSCISSHLRLMSRRHTVKQSMNAVWLAREAGFSNISVDLIYGIPGMTTSQWEYNIDEVNKLDIQHVSAYHLTIEPGTPLYRFRESGKLIETGEENSFQQFSMLIDRLEDSGFGHYEISNFGRPGFYSRHNTGYWRREKYLGLGPSAHSYDGLSRQWNVSDMNEYIKGIKNRQPASQIEWLDENTRYNEYIMTGLRTKWGIDTENVKNEFGSEMLNYLLQQLKYFTGQDVLSTRDEKIRLTKKGMFVSDSIITRLMMVL